MRFEKTGFSGWELIFAMFSKSRSNGANNIFVFLSKRSTKRNQNTNTTTWYVTLLHYNGSKITRLPLDVLSTELSMAFSPSNQHVCIKFLQWSKFLRRKNLR